uniref:Uncharacterized protein n=1 Tax=Anopheles merus TaxID=30066 RepID=A0A182VL07_ANOME
MNVSRATSSSLRVAISRSLTTPRDSSPSPSMTAYGIWYSSQCCSWASSFGLSLPLWADATYTSVSLVRVLPPARASRMENSRSTPIDTPTHGTCLRFGLNMPTRLSYRPPPATDPTVISSSALPPPAPPPPSRTASYITPV